MDVGRETLLPGREGMGWVRRGIQLRVTVPGVRGSERRVTVLSTHVSDPMPIWSLGSWRENKREGPLSGKELCVSARVISSPG